jgi:RHS repeat-associated protein
VSDGAHTWTYSYDAINRLTGLVSPQGTVGYEYSPTNYRTKLTATGMTDVTYSYDDLDRLTSLTQGTEVYGYTYDDNSRLTALTRPNGVDTSYAYDDADRLTQIHHLKTSVLDDPYDYTYDSVGNILTESRDGGTRTYTYDSLNRLTQMDKTVAVPGETLPKKIQYSYDDNSNLTQRIDTADNNTTQTTGYTYNTANYLTQMTPPVGSAVTYTYNGYGALTGDSTGRSFTWDGLQRLTQMTAGGVTTSFSYDPMGRRTGLTQGALSKTFFYDGLNMLSDGINTYLNGLGLDNPLSVNDGSNTSYYLANQIGSITRLSDATGASVGHYQYLPYGGLLSSSMAFTGNPFTFTAREDDGTGLLYYRARYYDPALQVFISQDPLGNDQRYVGGNPLGFVDPLGLDGVCPSQDAGSDFILGHVGSCGGYTPSGEAGVPEPPANEVSPASEPSSCPAEMYSNGRTPTARDFQNWAENQGWQKGSNPSGPQTYYDENGVKRLQIKNGSSQTPGSEGPHVEVRNAQNQRIDPATGDVVSRTSLGNHRPMIPFYPGGYNLVP